MSTRVQMLLGFPGFLVLFILFIALSSGPSAGPDAETPLCDTTQLSVFVWQSNLRVENISDQECAINDAHARINDRYDCTREIKNPDGLFKLDTFPPNPLWGVFAIDLGTACIGFDENDLPDVGNIVIDGRRVYSGHHIPHWVEQCEVTIHNPPVPVPCEIDRVDRTTDRPMPWLTPTR